MHVNFWYNSKKATLFQRWFLLYYFQKIHFLTNVLHRIIFLYMKKQKKFSRMYKLSESHRIPLNTGVVSAYIRKFRRRVSLLPGSGQSAPRFREACIPGRAIMTARKAKKEGKGRKSCKKSRRLLRIGAFFHLPSQARTSALVGMEGAAPLRVTAMALALAASSMASETLPPPRIPARKKPV